jgi:hypothetical protein
MQQKKSEKKTFFFYLSLIHVFKLNASFNLAIFAVARDAFIKFLIKSYLGCFIHSLFFLSLFFLTRSRSRSFSIIYPLYVILYDVWGKHARRTRTRRRRLESKSRKNRWSKYVKHIKSFLISSICYAAFERLRFKK